jgi:hypothetical protein
LIGSVCEPFVCRLLSSWFPPFVMGSYMSSINSILTLKTTGTWRSGPAGVAAALCMSYCRAVHVVLPRLGRSWRSSINGWEVVDELILLDIVQLWRI